MGGLEELEQALKGDGWSRTNTRQEEAKATSQAPLTKEDKWAVLDRVGKTLNKELKTTNSLTRLNAKSRLQPSQATGIYSLDFHVFGTGGVPRGKIIEIYGPESSGKTTLALHIVGQEQSRGEIVAYVDAEHSLDPSWAAKLGVNVDELVISQPDSGEDALDTVEALVESRAVSIIVVDSVAALVPRAELDGEMGESHMGLQARLMSQACRKLRGKCNINGVTVIFINQIREKIGVMFGSPEVTTGGRALRFYAVVRLDIRRKDIKRGDEVIGQTMTIKAVKNKASTPKRVTEINLMYDTGLDIEGDLIAYAMLQGIVAEDKSWYTFGPTKIAYGKQAAINAVKADAALKAAISMAVLDKIGEQSVTDSAGD